jgi:hypothetical protein
MEVRVFNKFIINDLIHENNNYQVFSGESLIL